MIDLRPPRVTCLGVNFKTADIALRESLHLTMDQIKLALSFEADQELGREMMLLSTCNRIEFYCVSRDEPGLEAQVRGCFDRLRFEALKRSPPPLEPAASYFLADSEAVQHLFEVVAGLDSLVLGETQISGQFKDSLRVAREAGSIGTILHRLGQDALGANKKIRTQTKIGEGTVSIAHAAVNLSKLVFGGVAGLSVAILGAGQMARLAATYASTLGPKNIRIVNRTIARAQNLAGQIQGATGHGFDELVPTLDEADLVIAAVSSDQIVLHVRDLEKRLASRRNRPLFLVDIGLPRNIHSGCNQLDDVYLFDLDDLKKSVENSRQERERSLGDARRFAAEGAERFLGWLGRIAVQPTLGRFNQYLEDAVSREFTRSLKKGVLRDLSENQLEAVRGLKSAISQKILADAARNLMNIEDRVLRMQMATSLELMFPCPEICDEEHQPLGMAREAEHRWEHGR